MTAAGPNDLARALRAFFADHLPRVRGTSPHTIRSYRDSLVLLLRFVATETQRSVEYLEQEEVEAVLGVVDRGTVDGRRDYALLATMFDTGARVGEIVALCVADLRLDTPAQVQLHGKGRKERVCPLWPQTADLLRALLVERGREPQSDEPVFRNHRRTRLTRFGVRYLLQKYCTRAQATVPALRAKRLHPHSMRHSTAVHLLRAGVDGVRRPSVSGMSTAPAATPHY